MKNVANGLADREPSLIKLYTELTGAKESTARGVFMFVCGQDEAGRPSEKNGNEIFGAQKGCLRTFEMEFGGASGRIKPWRILPVAGGV